MILAVVNRTEGTVDVLTGEWLELDAGQICVSVETTQEKKQNETLMTSLRDEARIAQAK
jgi:hypothetical protein